MLPDSENPFAPPREAAATSPVNDGLGWSLGVREMILTLVVLVAFPAGLATIYTLSQGSILPFDMESLSQLEQDLGAMMPAVAVASLLILAVLLWSQGVLFSVGGLITLIIGMAVWGYAGASVLMPGGGLVVWGSIVLVLILRIILLRRRTS